MITSEEQQKINVYRAFGENWGYNLEMTPLAIFENYLIRRSVVITHNNPSNSYIPIIKPAKDFDSRDYLYVKNALIRQEKEAKLLKLYREVYGVIEAWNTVPQIHKQIAELEGELGELK